MGRGGKNNLLYGDDALTPTRTIEVLDDNKYQKGTEGKQNHVVSLSYQNAISDAFREIVKEKVLEIYSQKSPKRAWFRRSLYKISQEEHKEIVKQALEQALQEKVDKKAAMTNTDGSPNMARITSLFARLEQRGFNSLLAADAQQYRIGYHNTTIAEFNQMDKPSEENIWLAKAPAVGSAGKIHLKEYLSEVREWIHGPTDVDNQELYDRIELLINNGVEECDYTVNRYWVQHPMADCELTAEETSQAYPLLKARDKNGQIEFGVIDDGVTLRVNAPDLQDNDLPVPPWVTDTKEVNVDEIKLQKVVHEDVTTAEENVQHVLYDNQTTQILVNHRGEALSISPAVAKDYKQSVQQATNEYLSSRR